MRRRLTTTSLFLLLLLSLPTGVFAWPADDEWIALPRDGMPITDDEGDTQGSRNIVPNDGTYPAAYIANDGIYLYYRMRLDEDPTPSGANSGVLQGYGWGFEIDTDMDARDYEWLIMCDGIDSPETVSIQKNTDKTGVGDPSDKAEFVAAEYPMVGNHRILPADTCVNDDNKAGCSSPDYFLDFRVPYSVFKEVTGITDDTLVRYFVGSSSSSWTLVETGADLVVGSDAVKGSELLTDLGDYTSPFGTLPPSSIFHDASLRFTEDLGGFDDRLLAAPGEPLYLLVNDLDLTSSSNPAGTVVVELSSPTGDTEVLTLYAAGVQGKYTGQIPSSDNGGEADNDGTLYVLDGQTITATFLEAITADLSQDVIRSAELPFTATGTDVAVAKTVDNPNPAEGEPVRFTVTVTNNGPSIATGLQISDPAPAGLEFTSVIPGHGSYAAGTWTVGTLAAGASATLTVGADANAGTNGQTLSNTATISALDQNDGIPGNDSASADILVGGTDLRVTKSVDDPMPGEGGAVTYTVGVFNLGPAATDNVQVSDPLPAGLTYVSDDAGGAYDPASGAWSVGDLAAGSGARLHINASVDAGNDGQVIDNMATLVSTSQPDTNPDNDMATATIRIGHTDLEVGKVAAKVLPAPADAAGTDIAADIGSTVEFTVTVRNNGPHDATGVVVSDPLPAGLTYVSDDAGGSYDSASGLWSIGALAEDATTALVLHATIDSGTSGQTLVNTAQVTAAQTDSRPGNESASARVTVDGTDIQVLKSVNVTDRAPSSGDRIVWTITVTNAGPRAATGVEISDPPPSGLSYVSHAASQGDYDATSNPTWIWAVGDLAVDASATLEITTDVTADPGETVMNVAFLTGVDQADPDESNNFASESIAVAGSDLAIAKEVDNPTPDINETITYTLTASNAGPNDATTVSVTDLLPPELNYVSHSPAASVYDPATGIWSIGALANGASSALEITATVRNEDRHLVITNTASITTPDQADPTPGNNTASIDIIVSATDLEITKTVDSPAPAEGSPVLYTVTVTNNGPNPATGIEVEDFEPAGVSFTTTTPSQGSYSSGLWLIGGLAAGDSASLVIAANVHLFTAGTSITNTATLSRLDQTDPTPGNASASVDIAPTIGPAITLVKTVATFSDPFNGAAKPKAVPGAEVLYTLTATNFGGGTPDADSVTIVDPLPSNISLFVGDLGSGAAVLFADGAVASGLTLDPADVLFSLDGSDYGYSPVPDGDGFDSNVRFLKVEPGGTLAASDGIDHPSFTLQFKVRID